jgi:drug/metabolite transporter (DMT)-like permease
MQGFTKKQSIIYSLLISVFIYLDIRIFWNASSALRSADAIYVPIVLYFLFIVLAGLAGYLLLRRKLAAVAAGSTALVLLGVYNLIINIIASSLGELVLASLGVIVGAGVFYGLYSLLIRTKRPRLTALIIVISSLVVVMVVSFAAFFILRMNFAS